MKKSLYSSKWLLFSDYCLDDANKPNDVVTFVMMPFIDEECYKKLDADIAAAQPNDLKHTRTVSVDFMKLIKQNAIFSFSFLVNDRKLLIGDCGEERVKEVLELLELFKSQFEKWRDNATAGQPIDYYKASIKFFEKQIHEISARKNVKLISDIILIALLGAVYIAEILKAAPKVDIFGWFPDRDKTNEAFDNIIVPIFYVLLYNHLGAKDFLFTPSDPDTTKKPFYDNENRIVDYICGVLAGYGIQRNRVSKDKYTDLLEGLIADNPMIKVYRLNANANPMKFREIQIKSK